MGHLTGLALVSVTTHKTSNETLNGTGAINNFRQNTRVVCSCSKVRRFTNRET